MRLKGFLFILLCSCQLVAAKDVLVLGNRDSERKHALIDSLTESYVGGVGETARRILPYTTPNWQGGYIRFKMKVNSDVQNYFTVRCWGSESDDAMVMLFIDGKQIGYRHLGDYDLWHRGNGNPPCLGRFYYTTIPLPLKYTQGKKEVDLEMRAYGNTWDYGNTFEKYQMNMEKPTIGFYKAYVHTEPCFVPDKREKHPVMVATQIPLRKEPGIEVFDRLKGLISERIDQILKKNTPLGQQEVWLLADAYSVKWTPVYQSPKVIEKVMKGIDDHYKKYMKDASIIYTDGSVYNGDWMTTCLLARSIRSLWGEVKDSLDVSVNNITRREAWTQLMEASLDYGTTHRRHYTNQSIIIDMAIYECNRALMLLNPRRALPEYQTLRYLYESLALAPWLGKETPDGPEKPLGEDYWQLTDKALTKELGYVGYYGEVADWVVQIYKVTSMPGVPFSGDSKIKDQLLRMVDARYNFRYPAIDNDGNKCFRAEAVVGWRDGNHYPGDVMYGDRGIAWDASPLMTAATTLDSKAVGIAQQMLNDNQFFATIAAKMKDVENIRALQGCLHIPDEYELVMQQPVSDISLPMSTTAPDYVFADEEDGVVAVKNGDEILYVSLYWRARNAVNNLAKVHYITPEKELLSNLYIETEFEESGMLYTRPDWVNLGFAGFREWYKDIHSAHAGEVLPIAKIPEGVPFKPGDENAYAGRADFYLMKYGKYVIGMNSSKDKTFDMEVPQGKKVFNLTNEKAVVSQNLLKVSPRSTIVLFIP